MDEKGSKKIIIGILTALVLIVILITFISSRIAFENIEEARELSGNDLHIRSELSQVRRFAEEYYYVDGKSSYIGLNSSNEWKEISTEIPDCTGYDSYQINISEKEYVAWAPLCDQEGFQCVDSEGTSETFQEKVGEGYSCYEMFN